MAKANPKNPQRPYSKPTLTIYGKVRELTKSVGAKGMLDSGGVFPINKTSV